MQTFTTSAETDKLDAALAKAQGQIKPAAKNAENPGFKRGNAASRYADLEAVREACRESLSANGIAVTQWPLHSEDGRVHLLTRLAHAGQWMQAHFSIPAPKADPQGYGSATTYIKRFALAAAVGVVASDEDDDGEGAGDEGGEKMPAGSLADFLAAIGTADTVEALQKVYFDAKAKAGKDKVADARLIAAKNARYKAIAPKTKPANGANA